MGEDQETPSVAPPAAGSRTSFGKYQLFATLGRGGMAEVFLAVARGPAGFNKLAVVKRLRQSLAEEGSFRDMFLDEARLAARLNHPNVVHTYEVGEEHGSYFIAMEYLEGQPLNKVIGESIRSGQFLEPPVCARIVSDALSGLNHAHELRDYDGTPLHIIHRDVSPHNVFVTYEGQVKLVDFGIAKAAVSSAQTEVGVLKGKVAYMAPEQAMGSAMDARADLFAMGIVLWELVTRQRLMQGDAAPSILHKLMNVPIPRASAVIPDLDPRLDDIIARALERDPKLRFQTALEMREALEEYISSTGRTVRQDEIGRRVSTLFKKKREEIHQQIQRHMSAISGVTSTGELRALSMSLATDSFQGLDRSAPTSGPLPSMGATSGSGVVSAVGSNPAASTVADGAGPQRRRRAIWLAAFVAIVGVLALFFFAGRATHNAGEAIANSAAAAPAPPPPSPPLPSPSSVVASPPVAQTNAPTTAEPPSTAESAPTRTARHSTPARPAPAPTPKPAPTPNTTAQPDDANPGFLTLETYPWTKVTENGRVLGTTPLVHLSIPAGNHLLVLENADQGIKQTYSVTIKGGETVTRRLGLK